LNFFTCYHDSYIAAIVSANRETVNLGQIKIAYCATVEGFSNLEKLKEFPKSSAQYAI